MAEQKPYDVGLVVRTITDTVLTGPDGVRSTRNAYPVVLQQLLMQLSVVTDQVRALLDDQLRARWISCLTGEFGGCRRDMGEQLERIEADLEAWITRLEAYRQFNSDCIAAGKLLDWECNYWCVTSPLLFGWYPNERCDGPAMWQRVQKPPDMATPFSLLNQAIILGAFVDSEGLINFTQTFVDVAVRGAAEVAGYAVEAAVAAAIAAAQQALEEAFANPKLPGQRPTWGRWVFGLGALGLVGYWIYANTPGGKR